MAGNSGLWLGVSIITFGELFLISIQIILWIFCCVKELPEVPSCRSRNCFPEKRESYPTEINSRSEKLNMLAPLNIENDFLRKRKLGMKNFFMPIMVRFYSIF